MIVKRFTNKEIAILRQKLGAPPDCDGCGRDINEGDKYFYLEDETQSSGTKLCVSMQCEDCVRSLLPRKKFVEVARGDNT